MRNVSFVATVVAGVGIWSARVDAVITLDASYDHASLESYSVTSGGPFGPTTINLVGRDNYYGNNQWRWMNFTASGVASLRPTFSVNQPFAGGNSALNSHPMVYSSDGGANWSFFDNSTRSGNLYTFSNNSSFTTGSVQVAYAIPYSYAKSVAHSQAVIASPWGAPTLSGNAAGVIGQSPGGTDDLGRAVAPRDIYAYRITNPAYDLPGRVKKKIVITTGLHAGETLGTHTYQGLVDFLIGNDPRAAVLRGVSEFYGYSMLNPDGRFAGNSRATVAQPNTEPNTGQWNPTTWNASPNRKDIKVNGDAMRADILQTTAPTEVFIDFHSTIPAFPNEDFGYIEYEQGDNLAPFWLKFKQLAGTVVDDDSSGTGWSTANFAESFLGAKVDITFETQFGRRRNVDYYNNLGKTLGIAFFETYKPTDGDANFDGAVNFADLVLLAQHYNAADNLWEHGDFNFSGAIDFADLVLLAQNYGTAFGSSVEADFALAQSLVPEPAGISAVLGGAVLLGRRRR